MKYTIDYYSDQVQNELDALPIGLKVRYALLTDRMELHGANLGEPHTKPLGEGLFELRLKASEGIARVFYCTLIGKRIVMLHSFVKKTQKTPKQHLQLATQRMQEVKNADTR